MAEIPETLPKIKTDKMNLDNNQSHVLRLDKNIAEQGIDFVSQYGEKDGQLIFDVLLYVANTFQHDLFNYGSLKITDFAKKIGYTKSNLVRRHPDPEILKFNKNIEKKEEMFVSVLENALYKAGKYSLEFSSQVVDYTQNEKKQTIKFYKLFDELEKHIDIKNKNSFHYTFKVSEVFTKHLSKFFTTVNLDSLKKLRQNNCLFLYLYLKTVEEAIRIQNEKVIARPNFDILLHRAEINIKQFSFAKIKLFKKLQKVKDITGMNITFMDYNKSGKHKNGVEIHFLDNIKYIAITEKYTDESTLKTLEKAFDDYVIYSLINFYKSKYQKESSLNKVKFVAWFRDNKQDYEAKSEIYIKTFSELKNCSLKDSERWNYKNLRDFFNSFPLETYQNQASV